MTLLQRGNLTTSQIVHESTARPLHLRANPEEDWISTYSQWKDPIWWLDADGENGARLWWAVEFDDGSKLTDYRHRILLDAFRRFVWSTLVDNRFHRNGKATGASTAGVGVRRLARWMVKRGHKDFSTLDANAFEEFLEGFMEELLSDDSGLESAIEFSLLSEEEQNNDVKEEEEDDVDCDVEEQDVFGAEAATADAQRDDGPKIPKGGSALHKTIRTWALIWSQSEPLRAAGVQVMPADPLAGQTAREICARLLGDVVRRIPPLPDEVALPVMNEAHRWLQYRAEDIIKLNAYCVSLIKEFHAVGRKATSALTIKQRRMVVPFEFSVEPGQGKPWHETISMKTSQVRGRTSKEYFLELTRVRKLVDALCGACCVVLESESGMRPAELRSIPAGINKSTGKHVAIAEELSPSGLYTMFSVRGLLKKTTDAPKPEAWLIGASPAGSTFVPGPVKAIDILQRIFQPWRDFSESDSVRKSLLVVKRSGSSLPHKPSSVMVAKTSKVLRAQKMFIGEYVDLSALPDESARGEDLTKYRDTNGRCIITAQWRKTYAMYMIRLDRRMLSAVSMQFKHLSTATTDDAYIGKNLSLMRDRNGQQARLAASFMYQRITGAEPMAGRISKAIDDNIDVIKKIVGDKVGAAAIDTLADWCERMGIKVFYSDHGKCFLQVFPSKARCHQEGGTVHWSRKQPNFEHREPDLCNGCECFGVDGEHAEFWKERYVANQTALLAAQASGKLAGFRVIQDRAKVALNMCKALEVEVPMMEIPS